MEEVFFLNGRSVFLKFSVCLICFPEAGKQVESEERIGFFSEKTFLAAN